MSPISSIFCGIPRSLPLAISTTTRESQQISPARHFASFHVDLPFSTVRPSAHVIAFTHGFGIFIAQGTNSGFGIFIAQGTNSTSQASAHHIHDATTEFPQMGISFGISISQHLPDHGSLPCRLVSPHPRRHRVSPNDFIEKN